MTCIIGVDYMNVVSYILLHTDVIIVSYLRDFQTLKINFII